MRQVSVRLGPLALLLTVIVICMTVLGLLAVTTARGDLSMARRYADSVEKRYGMEAQGQAFLQQIVRDPEVWDELERDKDDTGWKVLTEEGLSLHIGIARNRDKYEIVSWQFIQESWEPKEEIGGLWSGE